MTGRALADAVEWGLLAWNPARSVRPPKEKNREMTVCWVVFLTTGLRRSEVAGLRWEDLDLERGALAVRHARVAVDYRVEDSEPKSAKSRRLVSLDDPTVLALRQHRKRQLEERLAAGPCGRTADWSSSRRTASRTIPAPSLLLREDREAGWSSPDPPARPETHLGHLALAAGVHPKIVQERLGHANISITLDTYSHLVPGMQEEAAAKVAKLIFD
ncbi:MAG: site-specific integrase [Actinomycetota bacterium]|nr:site-specific integrase [Actinomycetota bacterium]